VTSASTLTIEFVHARSHRTDRVVLLRCLTQATDYTAVNTNCSVPVVDCCTGSTPTGLYCNSVFTVLYGLPAYLIRRLQSVQNAAARLIFRIRRSEHITPALISLHWLRVPERTSFKLAVLTYRSIHGTAVHPDTSSPASPVSQT